MNAGLYNTNKVPVSNLNRESSFIANFLILHYLVGLWLIGQTLDKPWTWTKIWHSQKLDKIQTWTKMDKLWTWTRLGFICPVFVQHLKIWTKLPNKVWTKLGHGQTLDKHWTQIGHLSKICPIFVRSPIVQEHRLLEAIRKKYQKLIPLSEMKSAQCVWTKFNLGQEVTAKVKVLPTSSNGLARWCVRYFDACFKSRPYSSH